MKITRQQLAQIINEERQRLAQETKPSELNELFGFGGPSKEGIEWLQRELERFGSWREDLINGLDARQHTDLQATADNLYKQYGTAARSAPRGSTQGEKNRGIVQVWELLGKWVQGLNGLADMMRAGKDQRKDILPALMALPGSELWHGNSAKPADVATLVKGAIQKKRYSENNKLTLTDLQQIVQEEIVKLNEEK